MGCNSHRLATAAADTVRMLLLRAARDEADPHLGSGSASPKGSSQTNYESAGGLGSSRTDVRPHSREDLADLSDLITDKPVRPRSRDRRFPFRGAMLEEVLVGHRARHGPPHETGSAYGAVSDETVQDIPPGKHHLDMDLNLSSGGAASATSQLPSGPPAYAAVDGGLLRVLPPRFLPQRGSENEDSKGRASDASSEASFLSRPRTTGHHTGQESSSWDRAGVGESRRQEHADNGMSNPAYRTRQRHLGIIREVLIGWRVCDGDLAELLDSKISR